MANRMFTVTSTLTTVRRASPTKTLAKGESVAMDVTNYPWLRTNPEKTFAISMGRHEPPLPLRPKSKPGPKTEEIVIDEKAVVEADGAEEPQEDSV